MAVCPGQAEEPVAAAPSLREEGEPLGLLGSAGHGPALPHEYSGSGWCRVHT